MLEQLGLVTSNVIGIYIYCSEKYNIMKVKLGCVFKCIYKHYILVWLHMCILVVHMNCGNNV